MSCVRFSALCADSAGYSARILVRRLIVCAFFLLSSPVYGMNFAEQFKQSASKIDFSTCLGVKQVVDRLSRDKNHAERLERQRELATAMVPIDRPDDLKQALESKEVSELVDLFVYRSVENPWAPTINFKLIVALGDRCDVYAAYLYAVQTWKGKGTAYSQALTMASFAVLYQLPKTLRLLLERGIHPDNDVFTDGPLLLQALSGRPPNIEIMRLLLAFKANPNRTWFNGVGVIGQRGEKTPLDFACQTNNSALKELLLKHGAKSLKQLRESNTLQVPDVTF